MFFIHKERKGELRSPHGKQKQLKLRGVRKSYGHRTVNKIEIAGRKGELLSPHRKQKKIEIAALHLHFSTLE